MAANVPVNFKLLRSSHFGSDQIMPLIGGRIKEEAIKGKWETCTIMLSYALNHAGAIIKNNYNQFWNSEMGRAVRADPGNDKMNYIFEVSDMKTYLNGVYGTAENYPHNDNKTVMIDNIRGRHGIIAFGHRHIDLWEGERFHLQDHYLDLWHFESVKKRGFFFWEATSEWGF